MGNEDQQTGDAEQPIVLPQITVEGAPPDIAADPQKLVIYEAFQDGYVAGTSGQPKQYVHRFDGDYDVLKSAYEAGYDSATKQQPEPPPQETIDEWLESESRPAIDVDKGGGVPWPYDETPQARALREWLGEREDPHTENPEYETEAPQPPPAVGPGD